MALKYIMYILVTFFALYGFAEFIFYIFDFFCDLKVFKGKTVYVTIAFKNEEDTVEYKLRSLLLKGMKNDSGNFNYKIIALDLGSTDNTLKIIKKISEEERGIIYMTLDELSKDIEKTI